MKAIIRKSDQRGVALVEFAIVSSVFFMLFIGIMEMGRVLFIWNSMVEATRRGARTAVVSSMYDPSINSSMRQILPNLTDSQINISYSPSGCSADFCDYVSVGIANYTVTPLIPFVNLGSLTVPAFSTTLPRESLGNN